MSARPAIFAAALMSVAAFPSPTVAQRCSRDDVAAIHQYCEQIPGAEAPAAVAGSRRTLREILAPSVRRRLQRSGPEGGALLALPQGVVAAQGPRPGAARALTGSLVDLGDRDRGRVVRAVKAIAGSGVSDVFRWALVLSTLLLSGAAWVRRSG